MVRVLKDPEERKTEIMDAAWELFNSKGYEQTSVNDILQKVGIAKGTFYYYFKSKDEILDAVIERGIKQQIQAFMPIVEDKNINAIEKIRRILLEDTKIHMKNADVFEYLHKKENIVLHQKSLVLSIREFSPIFAEIIEQGIREKLFKTEYPLEIMQFIFTGMSFLLDPSIFLWSSEEFITRLKVLQDVLETSLRAERGSFGFLSDMAGDLICKK